MSLRANQRPELLAPAGGPEALLAAVNNGADAVYCGLGTLNARLGAENFTPSALAEGCRYAHLRGAKVYLTANVLVHDDEIPDAIETVMSAWEVGVDAVIVQDVGLMRALRGRAPDVRLHASTQVNAHSLASVRQLARLGAARVTLARETSLAEIDHFVDEGGVEVESFVHGSLCYCYSGACLLSSAIGGRSANRGMCAQPCRLPYELIDEAGRAASRGGRYLLSPKDLAGISVLPSLVATGVSALKIEGRMKSPEYVALVTGVYRAAIDRAVADPEGFEVTAAEWEALEEAFSRGFTQGYLTGVRDERMMSRSRPNNRGVPLGRVSSAEAAGATVALERAAESDDVVEFWTREGRFAQKLGPMRLGSTAVAVAPAGSLVTVAIQGPTAAGDRVFRVANASLLSAARRTFRAGREQLRPLEVAFRVRLREGSTLLVEARSGEAAGRGEGPIVERARTKPITAGEVMEHVGRLGGTDWRPGSWDLELDAAVGMGYSALHAARREALERLEGRLLAPWRRSVARSEAPSVPSPKRRGGGRAGRPQVVAVAGELGTLEAALQAGADRALLDVTSCLRPVRLPPLVAPLLPRVVHDVERERVSAWVREGGTVAAADLGSLSLAAAAGATVEADWPLNALNASTVEALAEMGASRVWLSPELSGRRMAGVASASPVPVGVLAYGRVELMVAEHCALQASGPCAEGCVRCARRATRWRLRDRKGFEFPVTTDTSGRSHLYNSVPLDLARALPELVSAGVAALRLDFRTEAPEEAAVLTAAFVGRMEAALAGVPLPDGPLGATGTSGHFYRGVR
ncbi:MAG: U32 family peptidase [Coriobacteriia bacterium]|nr:U32 family peptidase [Coriobacteriia bacterium]